MTPLPFGLQLYTVRDHAEQDLAGTLARVKAMGYDRVELAGTYGLSAAEMKARLNDAGLTPVCAHVPYTELGDGTAKVTTDCHALGLRLVCVPWLGGDMCPDKAAWIACARVMDTAGARLRAEGIQLCYHNHAHEFAPIDGETPFDLIFNTAAPENLHAEIDTYWVQYGGADPVALIKQFAGRCPIIHIKDMTAAEPRTFTEVGRGVMDWPPIFAAARRSGVRWLIAEQDECAGDSLESAAISAAYLKHKTY